MRTARTALALTMLVSGVLACVGASAAVAMAVDATAPIEISGDAATAIEPGTSSPIEIVLTNNHSMTVEVSRVEVTILDVDAPNADDDHPCSVEDYEITQSRSLMVFEVPPGSSVPLAMTSLDSTNWPRVSMLYLGTNQNGCHGATLTLGYSADTAVMSW